jgi:hypothetical protein
VKEIKGESEGLYSEDWWIEFLESELDPNLQKDMEILLANSAGDGRTLEELALTREFVKAMDDIILPEDGRYYDRLHSKVMEAVTRLDEVKDGFDEVSEVALRPGGRMLSLFPRG